MDTQWLTANLIDDNLIKAQASAQFDSLNMQVHVVHASSPERANVLPGRALTRPDLLQPGTSR